MSHCANQNVCRSSKRLNYSSWVPVFIIAVLPKCPFCVMAYSGAISLCSGNMYFPNSHAYSAYIIVGLSIITLSGIILNNKGRRTIIAAIVATIGILFLAISQFYSLSEHLYYLSVGLLFFGIWYNGSFHYFYRNYFDKKHFYLNHTNDSRKI